MTTPAFLVQLFEPWAQFYADSKTVQTLVVFGHVAAMMFAGGLAITLDRGTLRALKNPALRSAHLEALAAAHRLVITGLVISAVTGLMLFTSDVETYFVSLVYWSKMSFVVGLLVNGYAMTRTEAVARIATGAVVEPAWQTLRWHAIGSMLAWFTIAFLGVALVNAA